MDRHDTRHVGAHRARVSAVIVASLLASGLGACGTSNSSTTKAAVVGTNASAATPGTALAAGQPANVSFQTTVSSSANGPSDKLRYERDVLRDFPAVPGRGYAQSVPSGAELPDLPDVSGARRDHEGGVHGHGRVRELTGRLDDEVNAGIA
jgi:hypothetical protein